MNNSVGILTFYYGSYNYGGNLQAYALCNFLTKQGFFAEQITYDYAVSVKQTQKSFFQKLKSISIKKVISKLKYIKNKVLYKRDNAKNNCLTRKKEAFKNFSENCVAHTERIYSIKTVSESVTRYNSFVTGSDQVWNFGNYQSPFFLNFVPSNKKKMSYAASMAMDSLTEEQKVIVKEHLKDFSAISVREEKSLELLEGLTPVEPICVVDPVLLLDRTEWDKICSERVVEDKYLFCYFLGNNKMERKIAEKFAKNNGLKVVHIAVAGKDVKFGDVRLFDVSPQDFISLIKHAEYVFTDSFHATVFSHIYQKQFFVFNRDKNGSMNSRIKSIVELFECPERFCEGKDKENINYITELNDIDYNKDFKKLEELKEKSVKFLLDNLK